MRYEIFKTIGPISRIFSVNCWYFDFPFRLTKISFWNLKSLEMVSFYSKNENLTTLQTFDVMGKMDPGLKISDPKIVKNEHHKIECIFVSAKVLWTSNMFPQIFSLLKLNVIQYFDLCKLYISKATLLKLINVGLSE